jgi:hypothetical protein
MNYNESAIIYTVSEQKDGMGGYQQVRSDGTPIKCKVAPYTVREVNSVGLFVTYSRNKLFTQDKTFIDDIYADYLIEYKGVMYRKITVMDANKCLIIEMEALHDGYQRND